MDTPRRRELEQWLRDNSLLAYTDLLTRHAIGLDVLRDLTDDDLLGLGIPLGDRRRFLRAAAQARTPPAAALPPGPGNGGAAEERRQMTLVFIDLVGSTSLSRTLDIEDYTDLIQTYQFRCSETIRRRLGFVAHFIGDGVVAYFGYPAARENDAERAVLAALDTVEAIGALTTPAGVGLQARAGVATGDVLVSELAGPLGPGMPMMALGETPNLAARLQAEAAPGVVAISARTRALLGSNFETELLGTRVLKGFDEPEEIWIVRGARATELRFQSRRLGETELVGRAEELRTLDLRWQKAVAGEGQVVLLSGEAGIGKSRLAHALLDRIEPGTRLGFQCSLEHNTDALHPISSQVALAAGILRSDSDATRLDRLERLVEAWGLSPGTLAPVLASLLAVPADRRYALPAQEPQELRELVVSTLIDSLLALSRRKPLLVLFEDLHWIDPSSEELLQRLAGVIERERVMLLCTSRPEYRPSWRRLPWQTVLPLSRLDRRAARSVIAGVAGERGLPDDQVERIIEKADGVPLFLEELARMVRDRHPRAADGAEGVEAGDLALPATLKDLLRTKIDSLGSGRDLVSICAAIGRSFSAQLVAAVSGRPLADTEAGLDALVRQMVLAVERGGARGTYGFRHALIQDAAYATLLKSRARVLHGTIAETMLRLYPDLAEAAPGLVARHFARAGRPAEARDHWTRAAVLASERSANEEAIRHIEAALGENAKTPDPAERRRCEVGLRKLLNVALDVRTFGSQEQLENFQRLHDLQGETESDTDRFLVLHGLFGMHLMAGDPREAHRHCAPMAALAERTRDPAIATLAEHNLGMSSFMLGDFGQAVRAFDRALLRRRETGLDAIKTYYPADPAIVDRAMRAWALVLGADDPGAARDELLAVREAVEGESHTFSRCYAECVLAAAFQAAGDPEGALGAARAALGISRDGIFNYWKAWSRIVHGWAMSRLGDPRQGIADLRQGIDDYAATGSRQILPYALTLLADALRTAGSAEEALEVLEEVEALRSSMTVAFHAGIAARVAEALRGARD